MGQKSGSSGANGLPPSHGLAVHDFRPTVRDLDCRGCAMTANDFGQSSVTSGVLVFPDAEVLR